MLILVLGNIETGKSYFVANELHNITQTKPAKIYDKCKLTQTDIDVISLSRTTETIVIEALGDIDVPTELRKTADFVVFTSICAFERFFCRTANENPKMIPGEILRASAIMRGPRPRAIFNRAECKLTSYL